MQIATELFVREGYTATSLSDIAKSAGVATRTLYQHFGDKKAIFQNVMFAPTPAADFPLAKVADDESLFGALMRTAEYVRDVSFDPTTVDMMRLAIAESKRFPDMMQRSLPGATPGSTRKSGRSSTSSSPDAWCRTTTPKLRQRCSST
jgi:TetR/AcrR family transcriptional repressor of mexJK operon